METGKQHYNEPFGNYCLEIFKLSKVWRTDIKEVEIVNYIYDGINYNLK